MIMQDLDVIIMSKFRKHKLSLVNDDRLKQYLIEKYEYFKLLVTLLISEIGKFPPKLVCSHSHHDTLHSSLPLSAQSVICSDFNSFAYIATLLANIN